MIIRCAWCGKIGGEKEPLEDRAVTDGCCDRCQKVYFGDLKDRQRVFRVEEIRRGGVLRTVVNAFWEEA